MKEKVLNALICCIFTDSFENPVREICLRFSKSYVNNNSKVSESRIWLLRNFRGCDASFADFNIT